jgi:hypothetical protein
MPDQDQSEKKPTDPKPGETAREYWDRMEALGLSKNTASQGRAVVIVGIQPPELKDQPKGKDTP